MNGEAGLSMLEIMRVVNDYIGVKDGYLSGFTYSTHIEFYTQYCGLDIDPTKLPGTTLERFIAVIRKASAADQTKILKGVLKKFPLPPDAREVTRRAHAEILEAIRRLGAAPGSTRPGLQIASEIVGRAIADAEALIRAGDSAGGLARIRSALNGYLLGACDRQRILHAHDASLADLFQLLRQNHPAMKYLGPGDPEIARMLQAFSAVLDVLNPGRNRAGAVPAAASVPGHAEAMLVVNAARTIFHYFDKKLTEQPA